MIDPSQLSDVGESPLRRSARVTLQILSIMLDMTTALRLAAIIAVLAPAAMPQAASPDTFEVASVKPIGPVPAGGGRGTSASGGAGLGCDGGFPRVDRSTFAVTTTPYALITWAYGYNKTWGCSYVSFGDLLTGGPSWIRSQRFEIQARIPEGAPAYTFDQFMRGDAPGLEKMLQSLLAERFKLVVHRETKQVAGYALVLGKGGSKLTHSAAEDKRGLGIRREIGPNGQISNKMVGRKVEMRDFAFLLLLTTQRPVIDRTGLTGEFNFDLEFAPFDSDGANSDAPSLFTEVQRLGLRLETTKAPLDGLVIDSAEQPAEN
jgi:uncharacterized protein (TIGR03435 family)